MQPIRLVILSCILCCISAIAAAQGSQRDSTTRFFGVPLLFYSPDTKLGFGVAGIVTFPSKPFRSSITFGMVYTQLKQFLLYLPYQFYTRDQQWRLYGEVGFYRYTYRYFGIGNKYPNDYVENYTVQYPRVRITALRRIEGQHFAGLRLYMDDYHFLNVEEGGEIAQKTLPGSSGGMLSSFGGVWQYDTRDNQFYPGDGWLVEASLTGDSKITASDFNFVRFSFDAVHYNTFWNNHKLAINLFSVLSSSGNPFFNMPLISTPRRLRGYPEGKYRDRNVVLAQAEWRFPIFWRFKGAAFWGAGTVFGTKGEGVKLRPNAGVGLRFEFDRRQQLHLRIDYGFGAGKGNNGAYVTIGEAF